MNLAAPADTVLQIKRVFDAPAEQVFDAWMIREEWQAWIGPEGIDCEVPLFEPRVGGRYKLNMRLTTGDTMYVVGVFKTIDRPVTFAYTWGAEGSDQHTLVSVTLKDLGNGKTELTLRHQGLPTPDSRDNHGRGWNSALNKLAAYLARVQG